MVNRRSIIRIRKLPSGDRVGLLKTEAGRVLHSHEVETPHKLLRFGYDIYCQIEANLPYVKVADIVWRDDTWEMKNITGGTRYTIKNNLKKAKRQSASIILDISGSPIGMQSAINHTRDRMRDSRSIRTVLIIDSDSYCIIERSAL